jgi:adenine specific DNA methylase Mod
MAKKSYDHLSREDLIALLKKRDSERKLGLVWERDEIEHEAALNNDFVALDLVPELSAGNAPYRNMIIEGDNFDALRYLGIAYKGRVKAIYVDVHRITPAMATFLYNDHYMDTEDRYRQSTWLEFLYPPSSCLARDPHERKRWRADGLDQRREPFQARIDAGSGISRHACRLVCVEVPLRR